MKFIEVIEYNKMFPEGHWVRIPIYRIEKFYKSPEDSVFIIDEDNKIEIKHKTMIECCSRSHLPRYYFSDLSYEEFEEESQISQVHAGDYDIKNRFKILDL